MFEIKPHSGLGASKCGPEAVLARGSRNQTKARLAGLRPLAAAIQSEPTAKV